MRRVRLHEGYGATRWRGIFRSERITNSFLPVFALPRRGILCLRQRMAEGARFELARAFADPTRFPGVRIRPLCHPSDAESG